MDMTMRANHPASAWLGAMAVAVSLTACGNRTAPLPAEAASVMDAGGGTFTLATVARPASAAVERGLNQATEFCAERNRLISVQGTRIEAETYRIAFRCLEGAPGPAPTVMAAQTPLPTGVPAAAPSILGVSPTIVRPAPANSLFAPSARLSAPPPITRTPSLPGAASPLQPIAGPPAARPAAERNFGGGTLPASSFWQTGR
jgi:hypothetical protein